MKSLFLSVLVVCFLFGSLSLVTAAPNNIRSESNTQMIKNIRQNLTTDDTARSERLDGVLDQIPLEILIERSTTALSRMTSSLEQLQTRIDGLYFDTESKQTTLELIDETILQLQTWQTDISQAQSPEDLRNIRREAQSYIQTQRTVIRESLQNLKNTHTVLSEEKITQAIQQIESVLKILTITCREQQDSIAVIENNLEQLELLLVELQESSRAQDYQQAKNLIQDSRDFIRTSVEAIRIVLENCPMPSQ
jgi:hypothetical protein